MSFNIEQVYCTAGTELTTTTLSTQLNGAVDMLHDGTYLWVSCGANGIGIFSYYGSYCFDEPTWAELDATTYDQLHAGLSKKLRLVTYIKITATQVLRTTVLPALSLFPGLSPSDADGTYSISGQSVIVKTLESGERAITTAITRTGGDLNLLNAYYMCKDGSKVYVSNSNTFSEIFSFDIATQDFSSAFRITTPVSAVYPTMTSNLCQANGKLWTVCTMTSNDIPQKLQSYNLSTTAVIQTDIPVRPGTARSWVADGYNGSVYVTNYNNLSVTRFSYSNVFGATIRVNSSPTRVFTDSTKKIWVSSYAGMLSLIDWDDDGVHNDWGTESSALAVQVDPTDSSQIWFCNGNAIVKHDLNTHYQTELGEETDDWVWTNARLAKSPGGTFSGGLYLGQSISAIKSQTITLAFQKLISRETFDGTNTFNPDIIIRTAAGVKLVEWLDYTVNKTAGTITFLATSTVVTSPSSPVTLYVDCLYFNFSPDLMLLTPATTYTSGGTINVDPYLHFVSDNVLHSIRLDTYMLNRPASTGVTGQGAVVAGSNQYFGD